MLAVTPILATLLLAQPAPEVEVVVVEDERVRIEFGPGFPPENRRAYLQWQPVRETLTDYYFEIGDRLNRVGVTPTFDLWVVYQTNLSGGAHTDHDANALYYLSTHFDLEKLAGVRGASAYVRVEGGFGDSINDTVGAVMDVNGMASDDQPIAVSHLWYTQTFAGKRVRVRVGKLDTSADNFEFHGESAGFDALRLANSPRTQFLDSGLVNNEAIPFPESGLGVMALVEPIERVYIAGAAARADADEYTFSNPFDGRATWMGLGEIGGVVTLGEHDLPGQWYAGAWYSEFENLPSGGGVYLGASQLLLRTPGTERAGLGVFARYGYADRNPSGVRHSYNVGVTLRGPFAGRRQDVLAIGWVQSFTRGDEFEKPYEGALEAYYRARLTSWLYVSPHAQYVVNPGSSDDGDAVTLGVRLQVTF